MSDDLRYPIGPWVQPASVSAGERAALIEQVAALPGAMRAAVAGLSDSQLDTPYRPGGWTVRQVVHHVADSHMNGYVRNKLALTEERPVIKPYAEALWADLPDSTLPIEPSLRILDAVHERWVLILRSLGEADFARGYDHPEAGPQTLASSLANYAWHGRHHVAHITRLRERSGW